MQHKTQCGGAAIVRLGPRHTKSKAAVALLLTFSAGLVDIVGLLSVYKLFTAHMTGTTVHLGEQLVLHDWRGAFLAAVIVFSFLVASLVGRVIIEIAARRRIRRAATITFVLELLLLLTVASWGGNMLHAKAAAKRSINVIATLLAMLAAAMGLQTATLTKIGPLTVHTTFVTGMLNKLAQSLSRWLFFTYDLRHATHSAERQTLATDSQTASSEARFVSAIWALYLGGAVLGTWLSLRWQLQSLYLACAMLLVAIGVDQVRPLSIEEEKEQES